MSGPRCWKPVDLVPAVVGLRNVLHCDEEVAVPAGDGDSAAAEAVSADGTYNAEAEVSADSNWYNSRSYYTDIAADRSVWLRRPDKVHSWPQQLQAPELRLIFS